MNIFLNSANKYFNENYKIDEGNYRLKKQKLTSIDTQLNKLSTEEFNSWNKKLVTLDDISNYIEDANKDPKDWIKLDYDKQGYIDYLNNIIKQRGRRPEYWKDIPLVQRHHIKLRSLSKDPDEIDINNFIYLTVQEHTEVHTIYLLKTARDNITKRVFTTCFSINKFEENLTDEQIKELKYQVTVKSIETNIARGRGRSDEFKTISRNNQKAAASIKNDYKIVFNDGKIVEVTGRKEAVDIINNYIKAHNIKKKPIGFSAINHWLEDPEKENYKNYKLAGIKKVQLGTTNTYQYWLEWEPEWAKANNLEQKMGPFKSLSETAKAVNNYGDFSLEVNEGKFKDYTMGKPSIISQLVQSIETTDKHNTQQKNQTKNSNKAVFEYNYKTRRLYPDTKQVVSTLKEVNTILDLPGNTPISTISKNHEDLINGIIPIHATNNADNSKQYIILYEDDLKLLKDAVDPNTSEKPYANIKV